MLTPVCLCDECGLYFKSPKYINNCYIAEYTDGVRKFSKIHGIARCPGCKVDRTVIVESWVEK